MKKQKYSSAEERKLLPINQHFKNVQHIMILFIS